MSGPEMFGEACARMAISEYQAARISFARAQIWGRNEKNWPK